MSGLEPGLVLGILPLIISAAEHYNNVFRPFTLYNNFATEVGRFQRQLRVQKTIFRHQCLILLESAALQDAASMLDQRSHPLWADQETAHQLADFLKESEQAYIDIIELIEERLKQVEKKSDGFRAILNDDRDVGCYSLKDLDRC